MAVILSRSLIFIILLDIPKNSLLSMIIAEPPFKKKPSCACAGLFSLPSAVIVIISKSPIFGFLSFNLELTYKPLFNL